MGDLEREFRRMQHDTLERDARERLAQIYERLKRAADSKKGH